MRGVWVKWSFTTLPATDFIKRVSSHQEEQSLTLRWRWVPFNDVNPAGLIWSRNVCGDRPPGTGPTSPFKQSHLAETSLQDFWEHILLDASHRSVTRENTWFSKFCVPKRCDNFWIYWLGIYNILCTADLSVKKCWWSTPWCWLGFACPELGAAALFLFLDRLHLHWGEKSYASKSIGKGQENHRLHLLRKFQERKFWWYKWRSWIPTLIFLFTLTAIRKEKERKF